MDGTGEFGRAVAVDMPGFGRADKPRDFDYEVPAYAEFIAGGARASWGSSGCISCVHDFGGPFGLIWGLRHPEAWASAVLINVGVLPGYTWHKMAKRWRTPVLGELTQAWIPRSAWRRAMQSSNPEGPAGVVRGQDVRRLRPRHAPHGAEALSRDARSGRARRAELGAAAAALKKPALVVWGAKDPYIGVEYAERQREFFDVQDVVMLPDSGHWPFQDDPERGGGSRAAVSARGS